MAAKFDSIYKIKNFWQNTCLIEDFEENSEGNSLQALECLRIWKNIPEMIMQTQLVNYQEYENGANMAAYEMMHQNSTVLWNQQICDQNRAKFGNLWIMDLSWFSWSWKTQYATFLITSSSSFIMTRWGFSSCLFPLVLLPCFLAITLKNGTMGYNACE